MTIRLFNLPTVVLRELFYSMDLEDLTCLALSSQKSYRIIKFLFQKSKSLEIQVYNEISSHTTSVIICFLDTSHVTLDVLQHPEIEVVEVRGNQIPFCRARTGLAFHFEDIDFGLKSLVEFTQDLFRIKGIVGALVDKEGLWVLDWVQSRQLSLPAAKVFSGSKLSAMEYEHILNSNIENLLLSGTPPDDFSFTGEFRRREFCQISYGNWITVDNLLAMSCDTVLIDKSRMTNSDINQFLKVWIVGGIPKTKWVEVNVNDFNIEEALEGLEVEESTEERVIHMRFCHRNFTSICKAEQENGAKAFIGYEMGMFCFSVD